MVNPEGYRKLILKGSPDFVELKGFSISGHAPKIMVRLGKSLPIYDEATLMKQALQFSPTFEEILEFARQISDNFQIFPLISTNKESTQVLMAYRWKDIKDISIKKP
jgi:wyosine [tRNA(Phe)-imidazoG37] synthetase (radical SAM superfamily)